MVNEKLFVFQIATTLVIISYYYYVLLLPVNLTYQKMAVADNKYKYLYLQWPTNGSISTARCSDAHAP